jgi:magnesium transporter
VQPLAIHPIKGTLSLNVSQDQLSTIPSGELGDIMLELDAYERVALFKSLDTAMRAKIISGVDIVLQKVLVETLDKKDIVELVNHLPSDMAVDLLGALPDNDVDELLSLMESEKAKRLTSLLDHEAHSAGGLMTTELITLPSDISVMDAINRIRAMTGTKVETIYYAYMIDKDSHLIGMISFRNLLLADPLSQISDVMTKRPISVQVTDTARKVSFIFDKYNLLAIPVINKEHAIQGIITVDDILGHIIQVAYKKRVRKPKL